MSHLLVTEPGPWGPSVRGGRRWRLLRRAVFTLGVLVLVAITAVTTTGMLLVQQAEANLTRIPIPELDVVTEASGPRHFLVVGSDARGGLDTDQREELSLGRFDGQRSDVVIYVAISADRESVSLVSFPRDLLVFDDGRRRKLTDTFAGGPERLVRVIQENFGLPVNHYAEISLGGFIDVVTTLGGVEICLDGPLRDAKSGADFDAGCHDMGPEEALAYVRSRQGSRADFERIDRQQRFLKAVLAELVQRDVLFDVPRLFQLVDDVASNVITDEHLGVSEMRSVADETRTVIAQGLPMVTLPAYPQRIDGLWYVVAYGPGTRAMLEDLRAGRPVADPGSRDERGDTSVAVWSAGRWTGAEVVLSTLVFAGFYAGGAGIGPSELDPVDATTIYRLPDDEGAADRVAAVLGAPIEPMPEGIGRPQEAEVVVVVGEDATS